MKSALTKTVARERAAQKKSLREVARAAGLSYTAVMNVEKGRSTLATAIRVAKALGIRGKKLVALAEREAAAMVADGGLLRR